MRLRVDCRYLDSLRAHLAEQGFPASAVGPGLLDVLFPAAPALFWPAAELDDWLAFETDGSVRVVIEAASPPTGRRSGRTPPGSVEAIQSHRLFGDAYRPGLASPGVTRPVS